MSRTNMLIISCSLNPQSRSSLLAKHAHHMIRSEHNINSNFLDLREWEIPFCDGGDAYSHPSIPKLKDLISNAHAIILAVPVYNYYANAAAKNLIELTGKSWNRKVVTFLCAAGGNTSYMSVMSLANSLMLDFRCIILPQFVYATDYHFSGDTPPYTQYTLHTDIDARIRSLCHELHRLAHAWHFSSLPDQSSE